MVWRNGTNGLDIRKICARSFALVAAVVFCALACNYLLYRTHGMVDGFGVFNRLPLGS